jgi:ribosomal protein S18 acetylase RimI-like enzyme
MGDTIELRAGDAKDAESLAPLIYASAPALMNFLFGTPPQAISYLTKACRVSDGQYSAARHYVAHTDDKVLGCMSLWRSNMPSTFHLGTIDSLTRFLTPTQIAHIVSSNDILQSAFQPPESDEVCLGHFAVAPDWQRKNVGSTLMAFVMRHANRKNKKRIVLDVDQSNESAISFYQKWGFELQGETAYEPTRQVFLRMAKDLS